MLSIEQREASNQSLRQNEYHFNPVVADAARELNCQGQKPRRLVELTTIMPPNGAEAREGVYILPNWEKNNILRIVQSRDYRESFTRGKSAHNVSFGMAELRTPKASIITIPVAIKPFTNPENGSLKNARNALTDATANAWVLKRGFSSTNPIAVICGEKSYIITPVKQGVQSLDTEPWHQFSSSHDLEIREHFIGRLTQVARILADLNFRGINQADSQLRNFWITPDGVMEPIDWESATIHQDPPFTTELTSIAISTLRPLYGNLVQGNNGSPIIRGSQVSLWNQFDLLILEPYIKRLEDNFIGSGALDENEELLNTLTTIPEALKSRLGLNSKGS